MAKKSKTKKKSAKKAAPARKKKKTMKSAAKKAPKKIAKKVSKVTKKAAPKRKAPPVKKPAPPAAEPAPAPSSPSLLGSLFSGGGSESGTTYAVLVRRDGGAIAPDTAPTHASDCASAQSLEYCIAAFIAASGLVSRFRSSHHYAAPSFANFGIEGH